MYITTMYLGHTRVTNEQKKKRGSLTNLKLQLRWLPMAEAHIRAYLTCVTRPTVNTVRHGKVTPLSRRLPPSPSPRSCMLYPLRTQHQQRNQKPDLFPRAHISPSSSVMLAARSTTTASIGAAATPSSPDDSTGAGASIGQPSALGSETEMDITTADVPPSTPSTGDSMSPRCLESDNIGQTWPVEASDDSWVEDWDMAIHRCSHCDSPFVSAARLVQHVQAWHTGCSPVRRHYREPPSDTDACSGELVVIAPGGDLFLSVSEGTVAPSRRGMRFQVASPILWLASRVFNSMFGPKSRFQEAIALRRSNITGFPPVVLALDDDPEALKTILTTLHFPYRPLPRPAYKLIVEIAAVCDKYELHRALQHVADCYLLPSGFFADFPGMSDWLLISYVFRHERIFAGISQYIILHLTDAEQSATIDRRTPAKVKGTTRSFPPPSAGIISDRVPFWNPEALAAKRNSITDRLVAYLRQVPGNRSPGHGQATPVARCLQQSMFVQLEHRKCEELQLRHLEGNQHSLRLLEDVRTKSLVKIFDELESLVPLMLRVSQTHRACSWVIDFSFIVASLRWSEDGLNLNDFPVV